MASNQKKSGTGPNNIVGLVMFRYMPYWPIFLILMTVCGIIGWVYLQFYAIPRYSVAATILVKDEKKGVEDSKTIEELDAVRSKKIVENEMQVISSKTLVKQVVTNLSLYAPFYEEKSFNAVSAYASSPVIIVAQDPERIVLPDQNSDNKFYFSFKDGTAPKVSIGKDTYPLDVWVNTPFGTMMFKKNPWKTRLSSGPLFFSIVDPDRITNSLVTNIEIGAPNKLASVISLSYEDEEPKRGKDILNELVRMYDQSAIRDKKLLTDKTLSFLDERIHYVEKQMDSIEGNVQNYMSTRGIVDLSEQSRLFLQSNQENDKRLTDINLQLTVLDEVEKYVASKDNNKTSIVPSTLGVSDPLLTQMLGKLYDAEVNYEKLKQSTAENNPLLLAVVNEIEKIRPGILETIRSQRRNLQAGKANLSTTQGSNSSLLQAIPQKERELVEIKRQQEIKKGLYAYLLNKREETALTRSSLGSDSRVVDMAQASIDPVSPKKLFIYLVSVMVGLLLGVIYVSIREFMTNKIMFRTEIENYTSIPVVGEITSVAKQSIFRGKGSKKLAQTILSEQFRQIRMSLKLYRKAGSRRKLLVTSSIGGEGKSFVSGNLARSLASSGKKVVLIDMDMRNPKTTTQFNLNEKSGIKEFLEGERQIEEIIYQTDNEHLFVIPAGGVAINPTELLLSSALGKLFEYLEKNFDYIIADTAPVQPVTDAYVVSEYCDVTLFVVRHRYTPKVMIQLLDDNNKIKALKNLNIVFNGVKSRGLLGSKGFGYGYGYGYEYGYGERKYMGQGGKEA